MLTITDKLSMIMSANPRYTDWRNEGYTDDEAEELSNDAIWEAESTITLLQAELAAVKAKLDAVRQWATNEPTTPCYTIDAQIGYETAKDKVLAILRKVTP